MDRKILTQKHRLWNANIANWEFYIRSYLGGNDYKNGYYLHRYILETPEEFDQRVRHAPLDNHCKNVVQIYTSFLFRVPPTRDYGSLDGDPQLESFIADADLDGRNFDTVMREVQMNASIYGNCWVIVDKPQTNFKTRAEELQQDIRPYVSIYTPENVVNWNYRRAASGRFYLDYLVLVEDINEDRAILKVFNEETISTFEVEEYEKEYAEGEAKLLEEIPNPIGKIPAVNVYNLRGAKRPIGISDLADVAYLQQSIYNDYSEKEQLIRLANHPSLVKTPNVEASAGAGSIIEIPEDMQADLKPYIIQPSGQNLDGIMKCIQMKVDAIDRITHMGSVRATGQQIASGIALQTEFQLLNARLSEKADYLENAEEHIWGLFAKWQDRDWDGSVDYPDTFDIRDWANDLQYLQMAKSSGIKSETFNKELDKQIAEAVIDDNEMIKRINDEIDLTRTVRGQFQTTEVEGQTVNGEEEEETS
tara:strand:- start:2256 stop:3686 length:1431 start_codon:yes stop_codon:yes gene_type:complete